MFPVEGSSTLEFKGLEKCVICLSDENVDSPEELEEIPLHVFNRVWNHLLVNEEERSFSQSPPVCLECRRRLEELFGLLIQVEEVTNGIRRIVTDSGKNGCYAEQRFYKVLEELKMVEDKWRRSTLNLLEQLGHGEIEEEDYLNWFPDDDVKVIPDEQIDDCVVIKIEPCNSEEMEVEIPPVVAAVVNKTLKVLKPKPRRTRKVRPVPVSGSLTSSSSETPNLPVKQIFVTLLPSGQRQSSQGLVPRRSSSSQQCDFCTKQVPLKEILEHVQSHVGSYALQCPHPYCDRVYSNIILFRKHVTGNLACQQFYSNLHICEICNSETADFRALTTHLQLHHETPEKPFNCPVNSCTLRFSNRQSVQLHIMRHTNSTQRHRGLLPSDKPLSPSESTFPCGHCSSAYATRQDLVNHLSAHILEGTPVTCDICKESTKYSRQGTLRDHYFEKHQIGVKFACEFCSTTSWTKSGLKEHVRFFHSKDPPGAKVRPLYRCALCKDNPSFKKESDLVDHNIECHNGVPFQCQYCEKTFSRRWTLKSHENTHKGLYVRSKDFICDLPGCGKAYGSQKRLDEHKMSVEHLGRTNAFICNDCGKGFNLENQLRIHVRTTHTKERKFCCEECGESFKTENVLLNHQLIHSGERPFECDLCGQRFRQKVVLTRHLQGHKEKGEGFKPNGPIKGIRKRKNLSY